MIGLFLHAALAAELSGQVTEIGSRSTISEVVVWVDQTSTAVDNRGRFSLDLPNGVHRVEFRAEGYKPVILEVQLPLTKELRVAMEPEDAPLEIVVEARRDLPHASFQVLDRERVERTPGTHDDPGRLIQALPGVASTPEYSPRSGDLSIRGAAPGDSKFYLDGVELPYLFHFQQYASVFHTRLLESVSIFPSTFGSSYGDAIGGIIESESRETGASDEFHGGAAGNMIMGGLWFQTPRTEQGGLSASARRSYADLMDNSSEWYTIWPTFWDYFSRGDRTVGQHRLSVSGFGAGDRYGRYVLQPENLGPLEREANPPFVFDRAFHIVSARHHSLLGDWEAKGNVALVQDRWKASLPEDYQNRLEHYLWLREDLSVAPNDWLEVVAGFQAKGQRVQREVQASQAWIELTQDAPLLARGVDVDETLQRVVAGAYVEPRFQAGGWRVQTGARLGYDTLLKAGVVDPRVTWRWTWGDNFGLRGAVGRYSQSPEIDWLSPAAGNPSLGFSRSTQASLGADVAVAGRLEFTVDGWVKQLEGMVVETPGEEPVAVDGHAWGVELSSRYRLRERFFTWLSVNLGESIRGGLPFDYDQPFALNFVSSWTVSPEWTLGLRYRYSVGLPYTPVAYGVYDGTQDRYLPVLEEQNSARLSDYQKIDARAERTWRFAQWSLTAYAEIWYVPSANNSMYVVNSYDYSQQVMVAGPSFVPLVGLRGEL